MYKSQIDRLVWGKFGLCVKRNETNFDLKKAIELIKAMPHSTTHCKIIEALMKERKCY